ncbi:flippase-like domain-containing protein [Alloscardovia theropitheci]|uniref:Flippase-like domain-containing protein n=1 Tax=Alloscardovia theropitheci TaxID=2496842 RepID=A0A4V2MU42_9BIFI|nr:lysylphosphatidylglycerol synthase transmembrane domain-containing protein [Alloscardovia theropitheci]TCD54899.1 flippase-like domain-containing protein [Alloscardovia theropitheci]
MDAKNVHVTDVQPRRAHDISDLANAAIALIGAIVLAVVSIYLHGVTSGVEQDAHTVGSVLDDWLFALPLTFIQQTMMAIIIVSVVAQLLINKEWFQTVVSIVGFLLGITGAVLVSLIITSAGYAPLIDALRSASNVQTLLPELFAGLTAFLTCAGPRRIRSSLSWSWNALIIIAAILVMLSANSLVGMVISLLLGRMVGLIIRYFIGSPNIGIWGDKIVEASRSVGLEPQSIIYAGDTSTRLNQYSVDDDVTFNSRRYVLTTTNNSHFTVSIADAQRHGVSYFRQLWQWIQLSGLSLRHDRSASDITHHHMMMLLAVRNANRDAVTPYAVTDYNGSSVLFLEENTALTPADPQTIEKDDVANVLSFLDAVHARGITHRHISLNSLARNARGELIVAGWENGDVASNASNIAADRVQILTLLSTILGAEETVEAARQTWDDDKLTAIAPFIQKVLIPSSVRESSTWNRNLMKTLRNSLASLKTEDDGDNIELVTLSRFNLRTFITAFLVVVALSVILTQLNLRAVIESVQHANPMFAVLSLIAGCASWLGSALTLGTYTNRDKRNYVGIFVSQIAQSFAAVSMPAGVGPAFVNLRFLRKTGHRNTEATAAMSAVVAVQFATTFIVMVLLGLFTGNNGLSRLLPTGTLAIVLGVLALVIALSMLIPPVRKQIVTRLLPPIKNFARQLALLLYQPGKLALGATGSIFQNLMLGLSFWSALQAFNVPANYIETTFLFLVANTIGSAAPTPGGLGGVETSLTVAFSGVGVPSALALSATLLFRVMTYWIRIPMGAIAMSWMGKKNLI